MSHVGCTVNTVQVLHTVLIVHVLLDGAGDAEGGPVQYGHPVLPPGVAIFITVRHWELVHAGVIWVF